MLLNNFNKKFWNKKKVFITGHTGFKGSWLTIMLEYLGAEVFGYSLEPNTSPNLFSLTKLSSTINSTIGDIRDLKHLKKSIKLADPDILFHLAAQPLVRYSYENPIETFETNVMGTVNILEVTKDTNIKALVNITTDKVYENMEWIWPYRETEKLGGYDPYSSSKACAELVTSAYRNSYFNDSNKNYITKIATARAGNVIGGGDWSKDRLIPDIIQAFNEKRKLIIRNPNSVRPWQHVLEPLSGYLMLAEKLYEFGDEFTGSWNFGPDENDCKTVEWIVEKMSYLWKKDVSYEIYKGDKPHEAINLKLDCSKSKDLLNWHPKLNLAQSIEHIVNFNHSLQKKQDVKKLCIQEIEKYFNLFK